ncbi:glycosyltransferase [Aureimonas frigidaquae]|uniref:glycosyltransferase n=1 Tax=Aureimonas frigidaquae TaxID=424757 RepID=UPI0009F8428B|nr:glycosyltransferase [Aureimonas frigidaquae]
MPKVSIVVPSYNHSAFIRSALTSLLNQSVQDIEVIVVDDASSDSTIEVIKEFSDPRLKTCYLQKNVGACEAMNIAISMCTADYIGVCNSDDIWELDKLERQIPVLDEHDDIAAVFSNVTWIDDDGDLLEGAELPAFSDVFAQPNRSRFEWLKRLIEEGNCLCHPSVLLRRELYAQLGGYNNYLRQLPDLDMWLRVLQRYEIFVMPERLVRFRIHTNNTSTPNPANSIRSINEHALIARRFFNLLTAENFHSTFGFSSIRSFDNVTSEPDHILRNEIAEYLIKSEGVYSLIFNQIGFDMMFSLSVEGNAKKISSLPFQSATAGRTPWLPIEGYDAKRSIVSATEPLAIGAGMQPMDAVGTTRTVDLARIVVGRLGFRLKHAVRPKNRH